MQGPDAEPTRRVSSRLPARKKPRPIFAAPMATDTAVQETHVRPTANDKPRRLPKELLDELHRRAAASSDERCHALRYARPEPVKPSRSTFGANWTCRHFAHLPHGCEAEGMSILFLAMRALDCDWPPETGKPRARGRWPLTNPAP
jgi:hypothetical protein